MTGGLGKVYFMEKVASGILDSVILGDCVIELKKFPDNSVDSIVSDIPYGINLDEWDVLHSNTNSALLGSSPAQVKAGAVFKKRGKPLNGWSEADKKISGEYQEWCDTWAHEWFRITKSGSSVFVFAGRRYAHRCITALEDAGFTLKDQLAWLRPKAPHRAQRVSAILDRRQDATNSKTWEGWKVGNLRPIFEPIIWFMKPYRVGTTITDNILEHGLGAYNENAALEYFGQPNNVLNIGFEINETGLHPAQKPINLMAALIKLTTLPKQVVLDPFCGSGTTLLAAKELDRQFVGIEQNEEFANIAKRRLSQQSTQISFSDMFALQNV